LKSLFFTVSFIKANFNSHQLNLIALLYVGISFHACGRLLNILQVDSDDHFSRIGGTATGGGTFWGLGKLLTSAKVKINPHGIFLLVFLI
jgi:pantothenate kinase